ncbi:MAG TPA: hypothetical protein EYH54_01835 [Nautiliaceae bacterium]|nr:hypothetical protein [Nautiliaceae bacterium]
MNKGLKKRLRFYFFQFYLFLILDIFFYYKYDLFGLSEERAKLLLTALILGQISFLVLQESLISYKIAKKHQKLANELFYFLFNITISLKKGVTNFITLLTYTSTKHFSKEFQETIEKVKRKSFIKGVYNAFKELIENWSDNPDIKAMRGPFLSIFKTQQFQSLQSLIDSVKIKREINEFISSEMTEMKIMLIGGSILIALFPPVFRKVAGNLPMIYFYYMYFMIFSFIIFIGGSVMLISEPNRANRIRILAFLFLLASLSFIYLVLTTPITEEIPLY